MRGPGRVASASLASARSPSARGLHADARGRAVVGGRRGALTRLVVVLLLVAACDRGAGESGRFEARVVRPPHDTLRFRAAARSERCGRGVLLLGISEGNGVLMWLRPGKNPMDGSYAPLPRGDSLTPRGAVVAVRTATTDMTRGVAMDSGTVEVHSAAGRISARASGAGTDLTAAQRVGLEVAFDAVPAPRDSVPCRTRL